MTEQHIQPCRDCPWRRIAAPGWLGRGTPTEWIHIAHGEVYVECHTIANTQCAGIAIYRRNVAKSPRTPTILMLPADREQVFATPMEFLKHHER